MGLTRRVLSMGTFGMADFRSDKERIAGKTAKSARYSKRTAAEAAKQTRIMKKSSRGARSDMKPEASGLCCCC